MKIANIDWLRATKEDILQARNINKAYFLEGIHEAFDEEGKFDIGNSKFFETMKILNSKKSPKIVSLFRSANGTVKD